MDCGKIADTVEAFVRINKYLLLFKKDRQLRRVDILNGLLEEK